LTKNPGYGSEKTEAGDDFFRPGGRAAQSWKWIADRAADHGRLRPTLKG